MKAPLDRLIGMQLLSAGTDSEGSGLHFDGCMFAAYSRHESSVPLEELVGLKVLAVESQSNESLSIQFYGNQFFRVWTNATDYSGPEAFSARFSDGTWIIENGA